MRGFAADPRLEVILSSTLDPEPRASRPVNLDPGFCWDDGCLDDGAQGDSV